MRHLIRSSIVLFTLGLFSSVASAATTAEQLVALSRAGLSDDILIVLIQTDGSTFQLSADDILALHRQGLSNAVIRAMQETARKPAPVEEPVPPQPPQPAPPPVVNVHQTVTQRVEPSFAQSYPFYSVPVAVPVYVPRTIAPHAVAPVYWGFGGQRRPDSWDDGARHHQDQKTEDKGR